MTDISAALGLGQLERAAHMRDRRQRIAKAYDQAFGQLNAFDFFE